MFEALIRLSLRYRNLTLGVAVAIVLAGANAWLNLPSTLFPTFRPHKPS